MGLYLTRKVTQLSRSIKVILGSTALEEARRAVGVEGAALASLRNERAALEGEVAAARDRLRLFAREVEKLEEREERMIDFDNLMRSKERVLSEMTWGRAGGG
jgi:hypothetical protein